MSLLHPNEDDDAMAQGYADEAQRKLLNRVWRLTFLIEKMIGAFNPDTEFTEGVQRVLHTSWRDEPDDKEWRLERPLQLRLPRLPGEPVMPCDAESDVLDGIEEPLRCDREIGHDGLHHCKHGRSVVTWSNE